jgi:hypothetical protein
MLEIAVIFAVEAALNTEYGDLILNRGKKYAFWLVFWAQKGGKMIILRENAILLPSTSFYVTETKSRFVLF